MHTCIYIYIYIHTSYIDFSVNFSVSDVALAIIQSDQWEDAMRMYNDYEELTPMKLLIKSMPGIH